MWDDASPFIVGTGPTSTVLDPDLNPNNILQRNLGGTVRVDWSISGSFASLLDGMFTASLYADPVGPGANVMVGSAPVPASGSGPYTASIPIPPNSPSLPAGAYRLTTLVTHVTAGGQASPLAGFVDGPIIQVREP